MLEEASREAVELDILAFKGLIDQRLQDVVANLTDLDLKPQLEYALLTPGKRLRPTMLLISAQAIGGDTERVIPLALSIETLHAATLVHDDIIDQDQNRRGAPTVYRKWGVSDAILVGDALISLSIRLASDYGSRAMRIIAETGLDLADGEHLETSVPLKTITEAKYFTKIRGKSASLFRVAAELGALVGGGNLYEIEALAEFGERFGLAYQIKDDLNDLKVKGSLIPADLRNGIPTLPIIHLYQNEDPRIRRLLERSFSGNISLDDARQIMVELESNGSVLYCEQKIVENVEAACNLLSILKPSKAKDLLLDMFKVIIPIENRSKKCQNDAE